MYHCQINFYFTGIPCQAFEQIKIAAPLAHFTHTFSQSRELDAALLAPADAVFANLDGMDEEGALRLLLTQKRADAQVIVLADSSQADRTGAYLNELTDLWICPMSEQMIRFRFLKWQQAYKTDKDFWQTSQYLETTIDHVPNLIWYKDKNGIHEKVN